MFLFIIDGIYWLFIGVFIDWFIYSEKFWMKKTKVGGHVNSMSLNGVKGQRNAAESLKYTHPHTQEVRSFWNWATSPMMSHWWWHHDSLPVYILVFFTLFSHFLIWLHVPNKIIFKSLFEHIFYIKTQISVHLPADGSAADHSGA